jgi:hypothetical protein
VEAFTPSTVTRLYRVLRDWPRRPGHDLHGAFEQLDRSRAGQHGGWHSLGVVRPPGGFTMGDGFNDSSLPEGIEAVWINVSYVTPALTMVVATFTITESAGDLSPILRRDYTSTHSELDIHVEGILGHIRARLPWARPKRFATSQQLNTPEDQKRAACRRLIHDFETSCGNWFFNKFPGRFATSDFDDRPVIRILLTKEHVPFAGRLASLRPVELDFAFPLWRATEGVGWSMKEGLWPHDENRPILTLAARRQDAARSPGGDESGESNWFLTQRFGTDESALATRYAIRALLAIYSERLGQMRDQAARERIPKRPVSKARALDRYLVGDGLDAATIVADVVDLTSDLGRFRYGVPEFVEDRSELPDAATKKEPLDYVPLMCDDIRRRAERLDQDTAATTGNLRASAELRQAIANTRLQRMTVILSVLAAAIALVSLIVATR